MRIAFVTGKFPQISQTFIIEQIIGLIELGAAVDIFASPATDTVTHRGFQHHELGAKTHYRPEIPPAGLKRWRTMISHLGAHSFQARLDTMRALNKCGAGPINISPLPGFYLPQIIDAGRFDIIHCHFGVYGRYCSALRRLGYGTPVVTTFHGYGANVYPKQAGAQTYRNLFEYGDLFTVNSTFLKNRLIELGCPAGRIRIHPIGVDLTTFDYQPPRPSDEGAVKLISVARLVAAKGLRYAIRAVGTLVDRGCDITYHIAGEGEQRDRLAQLITKLGLDDRVTLLGPKSHREVSQLYNDSDLFVLPSVRTPRGDEETQGVVVQEAQACGLPVVVTDIGGIAEGMIDGQTGRVCPSRDALALADAIAGLIERRDDWPTMARQGRQLVEDHYDLDMRTRQLLETYEQLAEGDSQRTIRTTGEPD